MRIVSVVALALLFASARAEAPARHASLPAASPDGKRIVFTSDRDGGKWDLYRIDADGTNTLRLTDSVEEELVPGWTADGRVLFTTMSEDTITLRSVDAVGRDPATLLRLAARNVALSHDGRRIAYTRGSWTRNQIVLANADGSDARAVTDTSAGYFNLAWSPDDRSIAMARRDSAGALQVWVMGSDGGGARALTRFAAADGRPQWPAWSPDGRRIAIQSGVYDAKDPSKSVAHVWVLDAATGKATRLAEHQPPWLDETPSWLDDKRIAFQSTRSGSFEVWVMKSNGTGLKQLTR